MSNNININNLDNPNTDKYKYNKNLSFIDLFFAGYGFIVGAGIFSLMPYVIKHGKGVSWLSFIVGGLVCLITGLSYAKLNSLYPSNDAEYSWILNILNFDENRDPKKVKTPVRYLANLVIWIVVVVGLFMGATILVGQADFIKQYLDVEKHKLTALLVIIPSIITITGNKYATALNKIIMTLVTGAFTVLFLISLIMGKKSKDLKFNVESKDIRPIIKASFITIFAYNGFQSIVQLSEESKQQKDIPLSIVGSSSFAIIIYGLITISVIALIGVKAAGHTVSPLADAYGVLFGRRGKDIVNILALVALTNTMLILTLSRSRLLQKLALRGIAPNYLKHLTSISKLFEKFKKFLRVNKFKKILKLEKFENENEDNENEDNLTKNEVIMEPPKNKGQTIPIYAIVTLSAVTYMLTFIREGAVDYLAGLTTSFLFLVFTTVNVLVLINYFKTKTDTELSKEVELDKTLPLLRGFPWYSVLGLVLSIYYLGLSKRYLKLVV
jgi:basic amino acid/polyamine antiporter, APA family